MWGKLLKFPASFHLKNVDTNTHALQTVAVTVLSELFLEAYSKCYAAVGY